MAVTSVKLPPGLAQVLSRAGQKSNVDFDYLLQTAMRESSLNPKARASTSSATGLFQFLKQTWLEVMKSDGARLGYGQYAQAIVQNGNGNYTIPDKALLNKVLALREDPQIAADLAAAFTRNNGAYLKERFGRMPSPGELYIAHFLGAKGAERLFQAGLENPNQTAAEIFPTQAAANRSIFYRGGDALSVRQVYKNLVAQHAALEGRALTAAQATNAPDARFAAQQMAGSEQASEPGNFAMSFRSLYSNAANPQSQPLVDRTRPPRPGFFSGFYNK